MRINPSNNISKKVSSLPFFTFKSRSLVIRLRGLKIRLMASKVPVRQSLVS